MRLEEALGARPASAVELLETAEDADELSIESTVSSEPPRKLRDDRYHEQGSRGRKGLGKPMNRRFLAIVGCAVIAAEWLAAQPKITPDGQPSLEGTWLDNSATPLERPKELEGRQFLSDAEVADLKRRADRLFKNGYSDFAGGDSFFLAALRDIGRYKNPNTTSDSTEMVEREFDNRTSLVVDPPDGRIPQLTPEGKRRQEAAIAS